MAKSTTTTRLMMFEAKTTPKLHPKARGTSSTRTQGRMVVCWAVLGLLLGCQGTAPSTTPAPKGLQWHHDRVQNGPVGLDIIRASPCKASKTAPVLLIPGMTAQAEHWQTQTAFLKALSALCPTEIAALSLRGRGGSDAPPTGWSPEAQASDIGAALGHLGWTRYHLVTHSMGVGYSLELFLGVGDTPRTPPRPLSFVAGDYFAGLARFDEAWRKAVVGSKRATDHTKILARGALAEQGPTVSTRDFGPTGAVDFVRDHSDAMTTWNVPTLVILGTQSMPPGTEAMYAQAPQHRILRIEHGHNVFEHAGAIKTTIQYIQSASP